MTRLRRCNRPPPSSKSSGWQNSSLLDSFFPYKGDARAQPGYFQILVLVSSLKYHVLLIVYLLRVVCARLVVARPVERVAFSGYPLGRVLLQRQCSETYTCQWLSLSKSKNPHRNVKMPRLGVRPTDVLHCRNMRLAHHSRRQGTE